MYLFSLRDNSRQWTLHQPGTAVSIVGFFGGLKNTDQGLCDEAVQFDKC